MRRIDFFEKKNRAYSNKKVFGLCDDDNQLPAYIDEDLANKDSKWIGVVDNGLEKNVYFYPVDHCVELERPDKSDAQKCEGILNYDDNNIIFTELKNRDSSWITKATNQIIETMSFFFDNYDSQSYKTKAWICNKQLTNQNYYQQINDFKEQTKRIFGGNGYILYISKVFSVK
ncbi:MAG: hypothetical protein J6W06_10900 [Bacteroidales bacterium]|nr:hypothetical protein [Bacteroidales bacterium]